VRELAGEGLNLNDEAGGESGLYARLEAVPREAQQSSKSESFPFADDLPGRVRSGRDEIVGQAFICEEHDLSSDDVAIG
jgi:hypothetical protein